MTNPTETVAASPAAPEATPAAPAEPTQTTANPAEPAPEPEQPEASAPSTDDTGDDSAEEGQPKKKGGGFQNRIDKLTREKYEADLRAQAAERELAELRKQTQTDYTKDPGPQPTLDQHTTVEEFQKAVAEWGIQKGRFEAHQQAVKERQVAETMQKQAALNARVDAVRRTTLPDYDAVVAPVSDLIDSHPVLHDYVMESEMAPQVAYHLAKNPAVLFELTRLSPIAAVRELTRLEAKLSAPPPPKPVTNAPAPIKPVGTRETVAKNLGDLAASDDASAYIARANKLRGKA